LGFNRIQIDLAFRKGADKRLGIGQQHPNNVCRASLGIVPNFCDQVIVNSLGLALVPRLREGLDEVSALRSNRSTEEAGKWAEKIKIGESGGSERECDRRYRSVLSSTIGRAFGPHYTERKKSYR